MKTTRERTAARIRSQQMRTMLLAEQRANPIPAGRNARRSNKMPLVMCAALSLVVGWGVGTAGCKPPPESLKQIQL